MVLTIKPQIAFRVVHGLVNTMLSYNLSEIIFLVTFGPNLVNDYIVSFLVLLIISLTSA